MKDSSGPFHIIFSSFLSICGWFFVVSSRGFQPPCIRNYRHHLRSAQHLSSFHSCCIRLLWDNTCNQSLSAIVRRLSSVKNQRSAAACCPSVPQGTIVILTTLLSIARCLPFAQAQPSHTYVPLVWSQFLLISHLYQHTVFSVRQVSQ